MLEICSDYKDIKSLKREGKERKGMEGKGKERIEKKRKEKI